MSEELDPENTPLGLSIEPGAGDVLLRAMVPPYRLGSVLLRIAELKLTGQLTLASDVGRRTVYFHSGFAVFSESSLFGERLGALGVRHGLVSRNHVARALAHARTLGCGLGQALLELERLDSAGLFALLGVQLREVVAAACGGGPLRVRFHGGRGPLRGAVILRLHPLTAVMTAIRALELAEQDQLLEAVAGRKLVPGPLSPPVLEWLSDLGYLGDFQRLTDGAPTFGALRARLVARHRAGSEKAFDPASVAHSLPAARASGAAPTPQRVADLVALTLLMAGALKLAGESGGEGAGAPASSIAPLLASLDAASAPSAELRAGGGAGESHADRAIEAYLHAKRERELAAGSAVFGPSVEAGDASVPDELMKLYLTLKLEKRAHVVLGIDPAASPEEVTEGYARRAEFLNSIDQAGVSPHLACRLAELDQCLDEALEKLLPGSGNGGPSANNGKPASVRPAANPSVHPPASESLRPAPVPSFGPAAPAARDSKRPPAAAPGAADPLAAPPPAASTPPPAARTTPDALAGRVEALLRAANWAGVLETLDAQGPDSSLPFTLRVARAMAQRELSTERREALRARRSAQIGAVVLGIAIGMLLEYLVHALLSR